MKYNVISADSHIDLRWLPPDLFVSNAPPALRDYVPRVVETEQGQRWVAEGNDLASRPMGGGTSGTLASMSLPKRGASKHTDRMYEVGFFDGRDHPSTPEVRQRYA